MSQAGQITGLDPESPDMLVEERSVLCSSGDLEGSGKEAAPAYVSRPLCFMLSTCLSVHLVYP